ncbi:hypothetical protein BsWGS_15350 [Bradybaena similaris]
MRHRKMLLLLGVLGLLSLVPFLPKLALPDLDKANSDETRLSRLQWHLVTPSQQNDELQKLVAELSIVPRMRHRKMMILLAVLGLLCLVQFLPKSALPDLHKANSNETRLSRLQRQLRTLSQQNDELQKLVAELRNNVPAPSCPQNTVGLHPQTTPSLASNKFNKLKELSSNGLTYEVEHAKRKALNTVTELWYFIDSAMNKLNKSGGLKSFELADMRDSLQGYKRTMLSDFAKLRKASKEEVYREQRLKELGDLVQRRLAYLQNPSDCETSKKIVCKMRHCGFGCMLHHFVYCLITAYAMGRTLVLDDSVPGNYAQKDWDTVLEPVSKTCDVRSVKGNMTDWKVSLEYVGRYDNIYLPLIRYLNPRPVFVPPAVPADLAKELSILHGNPSVWWIGQIVAYLFRLKPDVLNEVALRGEKNGFQNTIIGVHVRRTDKVGTEAAFHPLEEYMRHVKEFYDQLEITQPGITRMVYLATDEPTVISEARDKYPTYKFINDFNSTNSANLTTRYTLNSLVGIITDVYYLARCDYVVCTLSSQVCRVAFEFLQTLHGDVSNNFRSLDTSFYYSSQNTHYFTAVEAYRSSKVGHIEILPGDLIAVGVAGNHWDGFTKGTNQRTNHSGLYPSYKTEDVVVAADMPTYAEVPLNVD